MNHYHMQRDDREIKDQGVLNEIIKKGKYTVIAMSYKDEPYIVSLSYGYDQENNTIYFHSASKGLKLDFIEKNQRVCATIIEDGGYLMGECAHKYRSVVMKGKMNLVTDIEEKKHGMNVLFEHLEEDHQAVKDRNITNEGIYEKIGIIKLEIETIIGKQGQ